jgi:hypothetical protein
VAASLAAAVDLVLISAGRPVETVGGR